jgi:hypothetical protein
MRRAMTGGLRCVSWCQGSARIGKDGELSGRRIEWLDLARGIGVTLVVAGHAERGLVAAMIAKGSAWHLFDLGLYTFHMPLFGLAQRKWRGPLRPPPVIVMAPVRSHVS